jgi:membrane protease YdiL (CAAX protease family)
MSDEVKTMQELLSSIEAPPQRIADPKRYRWFELSLVLLVSCGGSFLQSLHLLIFGRALLPHLDHSSWNWAGGIIHEAASLLLLGYVLARRGMRFRDLGLRWSLRDLVSGLILAVVGYLTFLFVFYFFYYLHSALYSSPPGGLTLRDMFGHPSVMAVPFILLNPFFEELIVRAYVMTEVRELTGSWRMAAALSVAVQTSYHLYYGFSGTIFSLSGLFLIYSIYYAKTRRATPIVLAHGIFDFWVLIHL